MPKLLDILDAANLHRMVEERFIDVKKHPRAPLYILDYSRNAQFAEEWNPETMTCRGLIAHAPDGIFADTATVHARTFPKFFNASQHKAPADLTPRPNGKLPFTPGELPREEFEVFEKMDGSLGILSLIEGLPTITTRGSFFSEQAVWATNFFRENYPDAPLDPNITVLFEIIYAENRIVVSYDFEGLVLLGAINNETGEDVAVPFNWTGPVAKKYDFSSFGEIATLAEESPEEYANAEGFVVRFKSGVRAKVKFTEYVRLHHIVTGISSKTVYQHLAVKLLRDEFDVKAMSRAVGVAPEIVQTITNVPDPVQSLIDDCPDEMDDWLQGELKSANERIQAKIAPAVAALATLSPDRKTAAGQIQELGKTGIHTGILFRMLDSRPYLDLAVKESRPTFVKAFRVDSDA